MNVIITGASRGIGFELTKLFSHKGSSVLAISRNTSSLEKLELDNVIHVQFDLQEEEYAPIKQKISHRWKCSEGLTEHILLPSPDWTILEP